MKRSFVYICLLLALEVAAQVGAKPGSNLTHEDSVALATLATQPDSVRSAVLMACQQPEGLIKAENLQKGARQQFIILTNDYSKEEQKKLWDLSRYPTLIEEMTEGGKKSREELDKIAGKYPPELQNTIKEYGRKHHGVLSDIHTLYKNSQGEFGRMIAAYPPATRQAYQLLIKKPDVLNTLASNMHLAVTLGDMYKTAPQQTDQMFDTLHVQQIKQNAKDLEEWKAGIEKNPTAKKEMEEAAKEFAEENKNGESGVDDVYKTAGNDPSTPKAPSTQTVVNNYYYSQPYPYWFGYPAWYDHPYWYPYPWWYHSGFYWGPAGFVWVGFPSPFFMHWYLYHPYHHYHYPYFTDYCIGYSYRAPNYGPRNVRTGFNQEIRNWTRANERNLPKGYFNADANRPHRIREFGKFESDYHNSTKGVFGRNISRTEFLRINSEYYPNISPVMKERQRMNQPIEYPQQQNPDKFNLEKPRSQPQRNKAPGGFNPPVNPKGGTVRPPQNKPQGGFNAPVNPKSGTMPPPKGGAPQPSRPVSRPPK